MSQGHEVGGPYWQGPRVFRAHSPGSAEPDTELPGSKEVPGLQVDQI